jgi:hypothetical protein
MLKHLTVVGAAVAAAAVTAVAATAAPERGAELVRDAGCVTTPFTTTCVVVRSVTNATTTASGNLVYVRNGVVDRTVTFRFGGSYTASQKLRVAILRKDGEVAMSSEHYVQQSEYLSGTYHLVCTESYDIHWVGDDPQFTDYQVECTPL